MKSPPTKGPDEVNEIACRIIESLGKNGTLSDRLNPDHPSFDADLKGQWKSISKKSRAAIVEADRKQLQGLRDAGEENLKRLPFAAEPDDHCESPPEAYADIAEILDLVARKLGRTRASLRIYDPYFCAGQMKRHLGALGFADVHNESVDFYASLAAGSLPEHDVVVTNPPYSHDHVEKLLTFCGTHDKPWLLLMPNYVCAKPYFLPCLTGDLKGCGAKRRPVFVCPRKRYNYWTPKSMREKGKTQGHCSTLGHRTSPFISFWYVDLQPTCSRDDLMRHATTLQCTPGSDRPVPVYCSEINRLPSAVRP